MTDNNSFESFIQDTNNMTILSEDMTMDDSSHMVQEEPEAAKELAARQLDQLVKHMEAKLCKLVGQFHELVMNGSDASVLSQAQTEIDQTSALLERLSHYRGRDTFKTPKNQTEGSTISLRDIPKFQLAGQTVRYPNEPVYEAVSHFLSAVQKVLNAGKVNIDKAWKKWLPLAFDHHYDAWYEESLADRDLTWVQVKQVIRKKFDSFDRQLEMGSLVFTMQMSQHESVLDYGIRFQKACREGGVQENANLAMRFMSSLTPDLQAKVKLAWFARHSEMPQTIEQVALLANGVSVAYKRSNNENNTPRKIHSSQKSVGHTNNNVKKSKFFCAHHKLNDSHDTNECKVINKTKSTKTNAKICRHCGKDWSYNHKCKEYFSSDEYRKKQAQEFAIKSLKATSFDPMEHIANTLENASFE